MFIYNQEQWSKLRRNGELRFLLVEGLYRRGVPLVLFTTIFNFFLHAPNLWEQLKYGIPSGCIGLLIACHVLWLRNESRFEKDKSPSHA
jgi:hypothetical protein